MRGGVVCFFQSLRAVSGPVISGINTASGAGAFFSFSGFIFSTLYRCRCCFFCRSSCSSSVRMRSRPVFFDVILYGIFFAFTPALFGFGLVNSLRFCLHRFPNKYRRRGCVCVWQHGIPALVLQLPRLLGNNINAPTLIVLNCYLVAHV